MKLHETRTQIEADLVISRLRAAGLHPGDLRVWPHVTLAGADLFFGVDVPAEEAESARQIIQTTGASAEMPLPSCAPIWRLTVAIVIALIAAGMLLP